MTTVPPASASALPAPARRRTRLTPGRALAWVSLAVMIVISVFPIFIVLKTALTTNQALFGEASTLWPAQPTLINFQRVLGLLSPEAAQAAGGSGSSISFARAMQNSAVFTFIIVIGQTFFSAMAAYAFARLKFPGRDAIFTLFLIALMIPAIVLSIPNFVTIKNLGLLNTMPGMVAPFVLMSPFAVFFLRQFFLSLPRETEEAAYLDGAGPLTIFWRITLPMSQGPLITLGILTTIGMWNEFFWPFLIARDEAAYTLPVALQVFKTQTPQGAPDWTGLMAGTFVAIIPVFLLLIVLGRRVVESLAFSGAK
ncbi:MULTISPECIES: carbohydrate ABC transporter permease [Deinococcus]|uniref:Sugar ABC transporter permease n=1 Tax=Deinococcus knuensis TaxID=1837380 RepID=A0ABQ2SWU9_9DEIO|nr:MULTISPECIES: carbohydrate ABC transporter permease [Deinococcus]NTY02595.1 carbohydrate ABC transporter permease [Deinococcus sp. JMULE3]GGS42579.1 sugar ABC transporter permease [Deinococcus knuensis]